MKGQRNWIACLGPSGLDKRQATLHICIRGAGEQIMELLMIFANARNFLPSVDEQQILDALPGMKWAFQPNAWADGAYSMAWLRWFVKKLRANGDTSWHLLTLDSLRAQQTKQFNDYCFQNKVLPWPIPATCTDVYQAVDDNIGNQMKRAISSMYKLQMAMDIRAWRDHQASKALSAGNR